MSVVACSSSVSQYSDMRILIVAKIQAGFGDISAVAKITTIFKKVVPHSQIAVAIPKEHERSFALFASSFENTQTMIVENNSLPIEINEHDEKQITDFAPTQILAFHYCSPLVFSSWEPPIPTFCLEEYGAVIKDPLDAYFQHKVMKCSLGINVDSTSPYLGIGILQNEDLIEYFHDRGNQSSLYRIKTHLPSLSIPLYSEVVGKSKDEEVDFEHFDKSCSIYFAYVYASGRPNLLRSFIGASLLLQSERGNLDKDVILIAPGLAVNVLSFVIDEFYPFLLEHGFSHVSSVEVCKDQSIKAHPGLALKCPIGKRHLKIISGIICHSDFLTCLKISEPEVLGTGDQSISEQLAMGKKIYYQTLMHKEPFALSLSALIARITSVITKFSCSSVYQGSRSISDKISCMHEHFRLLQTEKWNDFIKEIHLAHNPEEKILRLALDLKKASHEKSKTSSWLHSTK